MYKAHELLAQLENLGAEFINVRPLNALSSPSSNDGCAGTTTDGSGNIMVYYGASDGSEDRIMTPEEFDAKFAITTAVMLDIV